MINQILLSTGAFTGRINGRDHSPAARYANKLECDGYELLIFEEFFDKMREIADCYSSAGLSIPVSHCDKRVGDLIGGDDAQLNAATEIFRQNCELAAMVGSTSLVFHAWGAPQSDGNPSQTCERLHGFIETARSFGIELLVENVMCTHGDPLAMLALLSKVYPGLHYTTDTRHAHFHRELEKTLQSGIMKSVRHIHINDYGGSYKQWERKNPILQPGQGSVDWDGFFGGLVRLKYPHSITLEAPSIQERGVDTETLNSSLRFIRRGLNR